MRHCEPVKGSGGRITTPPAPRCDFVLLPFSQTKFRTKIRTTKALENVAFSTACLVAGTRNHLKSSKPFAGGESPTPHEGSGGNLALQLLFCFEVCALSNGLVSSAPE